MSDQRVAVIGGGLAGITVALRCADAGCAVTLLEARPRLGGLTYSFRRGDLHVDNGQHVFMRCFTSYLALLNRLGVADRVRMQPKLDIPVRSPRDQQEVHLRRSRLPAPWHLGRSVLRYSPLTLPERLRFAVAALALRRVDTTDPATDQRTFADWLASHRQSARAVAALWDLVGIATLNAPATEASLSLAATVFQIGILREAAAADIGWSLVPLQDLHGDPAMHHLAAAGVDVRTRAAVRAIRPAGGDRWHAVTDTGIGQSFDKIVLAAPAVVAERLLPAGALPIPPGWSQRLGSSPIVNAHVVYDRHVFDKAFLAGVDTPIQWLFDRTAQSGLSVSNRDGGQYVAVSLSAADTVVDMPTAAIRSLILPGLAQLLPRARRAWVRDFFVTRERHATFRPTPGTAQLRPTVSTTLPGILLAGAWTATGWPATMEGAVRSGELAAAAVLEDATGTAGTSHPAPAASPITTSSDSGQATEVHDGHHANSPRPCS